MKNFFTLFFACFVALSATAQHYLGITASGAAAWQFDKLDFTKPRTGGGGGLGMVYEFQHDLFLLQTGISAAALQTSQSVADQTIYSETQIDDDGFPYVYCGNLSGRIDRATAIELQVPLMFGFEYSYFYFLAGARLAVNVFGMGKQTAGFQVFTAHALANSYLDTPPAAPVQVYGSNTVSFRPDLRLGGEVGSVFSIGGGKDYKDKPVKLRVGLFAEYGVLNVLNASSAKSMASADVLQFTSNHVTMENIYASRESLPSPLHNLRAGLRLTLLFPLTEDQNRKNQKEGKRRRCNCLGE